MAWKFDPKRAEKLSDPGRLVDLDPAALWAALGSPSPRTIVDVGAGTGLITAALARLAPRAHIYAADVSPEMLAWMRDHLPTDVADRVEPVESSETRVPLADGAADLVVMIALYHELEDPAASLADARRLLREGGRLLVVDWKKACTEHGPPLAARIPPEEIKAAVTDAGFMRVRLHDVLPNFTVLTAAR